MNLELRGDLRADPARAPADRNIEAVAKRRSIWPSVAVAAAAAAFVGVIWFAYQNGRDAGGAGGPPLVRADPGPVKVKPDNPGGQDIPFQDSTVYDRLAQHGQKPVTEQLLPPPEAPLDRPASAAPPTAAPLEPALPPSPGTAATLPDQGSPIVLAPSPGAIITAPPPVKPAPTKLAAVTSPAQLAGPKISGAPDSIAALIAGETPTARPSGVGPYRIRLSAVRSQESVAPEWARLKRKFPELTSLKSFSSRTDQPGSGVFYRVEAGPLDAGGAKSACDRLRAQGLGCIVVKP